MAPTNYELVFMVMSTITMVVSLFVGLNRYTINERIRVFGHE